MTKLKITIIILNYGTPRETLSCLETIKLLKSSTYDLRIILIDNGSPDDSTDIFKKKLKPPLKLIISPTNLGFAGGNNLGIQEALKGKSDYVLLLNSDTKIVDPDMILKMLKMNTDIVGPVVEYSLPKKSYYDFGGKVDWIFGRNHHLKSSDPLFSGQTKPDYLSGVCLLIHRRVFQKIGLLDDRFFLYYEDADFCLRAQHQGLTLALCPTTHIWHKLSASSSKLGNFKTKILAHSHYRFSLHHLPIWSFPFYSSFNLYLRLKTL